ncbi:conjugal transfer protein TraG N-terminal domain-containing protein [Gilvimarinus sp. SDUM040013]|uniref:Conjugal transfer protein TraG N-terminal domain-containing protein n=1 Tax=Gilvimarinus gilvus TaxID=3058038 RepID=A0ABU4S3Y8_9GAMM|nr:conjugal transfer protein TraG N-terminal domain-containing protein [Gilvimarinus sp. SDUM040013]MDO3387982.1 conjugal transfer protein TraG N-terminal domain-containing protein [Gilvimarinus sp. SDUM040013]MDX6851237.1 conjugal transfer protein TraG N-terminal domain-containing protein [Gilvimarinus sp. SDUM040013]
MIVNDAFELYTTVMGWHINNGLFTLMMGTGIILIPFAFIIGGNIIDVRNNRDKDDIGVSFFNKTEMQLYVAFFVLLLCVNPMINLSVSNVRAMDTTCSPGDGGSTPDVEQNDYGNTGTTYDQVQELDLGGDTIKIPVLWYVWDYVASSLSLSAKSALPCQTDIRRISTAATTSRIENPDLVDEFGMFMRDCWRPSFNRYLREKPGLATNGISTTTPDDVKWAGSQIFLAGQPYYRHFRAEEGLSSFPYEASRDEAKATNATLSDGKGFPFCDEWWESPYNGLRDRLVRHFKVEHSDLAEFWPEYVQSQIDNGVTPRPTYDDMLLKTILMSDHDTVRMQQSNRYPRDESWGDVASDAAQRGVAVVADASSLGDRSKALMTQTAAPMLRAILLMVITFLIPILLIASGYSVGAVVTLMLIKFSVYFWAFLFAVAAWIDNYLLSAWSGVVGGDLSRWILVSSNGGKMDMAVSALNFITRWIHILLPIIFTSLMGAVGAKAGGFDGALTGPGAREAGNAAESAPKDANRVVGSAGKIGGK